MDALGHRQHYPPVRVLPHIKKPDDALGDFIVRVTCPCGASRHIEPEALARLVGQGDAGDPDAVLTVRQEGRRSCRDREAEAARRGRR